MSNKEAMIEEVELSISQAKELVEKKDAVLRLTENKDFIKVITEGYFEKEASRLVLLKADDSMQGDTEQLNITKSIDAIGYLRKYLGTIIQFGRMAERDILSAEETRQELLAESL